MSDALMCGRRFRTFDVFDDFNWEALTIEIDLNLPAPPVIRVLERVALLRGYSGKLRVDNGLFECSERPLDGILRRSPGSGVLISAAIPFPVVRHSAKLCLSAHSNTIVAIHQRQLRIGQRWRSTSIGGVCSVSSSSS
jgi:hypothetical protein